MRIVDKSKSIPPLNQLGIIGSNKVAIEKHLKDPNGILLNTGPTGSGKTTTLYAALNEITLSKEILLLTKIQSKIKCLVSTNHK